jgi:tetratricopeptide (TPR) repeat protein
MAGGDVDRGGETSCRGRRVTRRRGDGGVLVRFRRKRDRMSGRRYDALGRALEQERQVAGQIVEPLLRNTPRDRWPALSERPELQTVGALERLGNLFAATLTKDPIGAMAIAELAVAAAEGSGADSYPSPIAAQVRAHAWKDLGKALRFLGRNREALDAFDTAEEQAERFGVLAHDLVIVRFNRAMSLQELERFEESRALLAECKEVFDEHQDMRNVILCGFAEGILLQRLRRHREARETYLLLFVSAKEMDTETRAALHRAIGLCSIDLCDFREAELNLLHAIQLSEALGQRMETIKAETALGRLYLRRGDAELAITHLRPIRREFLRNGLTEEAGICGLEVVEGLLVVGRTSAAETLARKIVGEFTAAGLNERAVGALGYLSEAITANRASAILVTEVREYIVSLRTSPERDFTTRS